MDKKRFEDLRNLALDVFHDAATYVEREAHINDPEASYEQVREELLKKYPILRFRDNAEEVTAWIGTLAAEGVFPSQFGQVEMFELVLEGIREDDQDRVISASIHASTFLRLLSNAYDRHIQLPVAPN